MRVQKAENVNKALEFIRQRGIKLTNIGPEGMAAGEPEIPLIFSFGLRRYHGRKPETHTWNDMDTRTAIYHCRYQVGEFFLLIIICSMDNHHQ